MRVYTRAGVNGYNNKDYFGTDWNGNGRVSMGYPRSELRICVNKGSDDPYENNDTWQTAAYVPVGNIQHVLSSTADADWFCFNVPESDMTLHLTSAARTNVRLYREDVLMKDGIEKAKVNLRIAGGTTIQSFSAICTLSSPTRAFTTSS